MPAKVKIGPETLGIIVLNVGDGDAVIIVFPSPAGKRLVAVVDCYSAEKTIAALEELRPSAVAFLCATHPHYDHTAGMGELLRWCIDRKLGPAEFWDSGFRHVSKTHYDVFQLLREHEAVKVFYPTSGFETVLNKVCIRVLSPSIYLKNRYDTFGTNINNASIVLKLEYPPRDIARFYRPAKSAPERELEEEENIRQSTVILGGDAQFDAWARITQEFPELVRTKNRGQLIDPEEKKHTPLRCQILKVPHHMSKHGVTLEVLETLRPHHTIASCDENSKHGFPHELTILAVEDLHGGKKTPGIHFTGHRDAKLGSGTVVALLGGGGKKPKVVGLGDGVDQKAPIARLL